MGILEQRRPSPSDFATHGLWSLWQFMEQLNAKNYHWAITLLRSLKEAADREKLTSRKAKIGEKQKRGIGKLAKTLIPQLEILRASGSLKLVKLLVEQHDADKLTYDGLSQRADQLDELLRAELSDTYIFALGVKADYFAPKEPLFGAKVDLQFPSVIDEISEAGKCYALGRSTACAFHAIRCLEGGIRAISRCLGIPDPTRGADRSWFNILRSIKGAIDQKWPKAADRMDGDGATFEDLYAALAGMQNPWRNATMHLDQKYTEEEARDVFDVVRAFMRRLANRCDENGQPLA